MLQTSLVYQFNVDVSTSCLPWKVSGTLHLYFRKKLHFGIITVGKSCILVSDFVGKSCILFNIFLGKVASLSYNDDK